MFGLFLQHIEKSVIYYKSFFLLK